MDGEQYYFTTQEQMLNDIAKNRLIEYGQFDGQYYGTKFDTIQQCIREGKMCILDISPQVRLYQCPQVGLRLYQCYCPQVHL